MKRFKVILGVILFSIAFMGGSVIGNRFANSKSVAFDSAILNPQIREMMSVTNSQLSFLKVFAADVGSEECNGLHTRFAACGALLSGSTYSHGALKYFHAMFCVLNSAFPGEAESALCHFDKSMGMDPDLSVLASGPISISKTFGEQTVNLTVATPGESFATEAGYEAKGTVTVNGETFMVLYWGGEADATKGFMIRTAVAMGDGEEGMNVANYALWDRTAETQSFQFWGARFADGYLNDAETDRSIFGKATYNTSTKAVTTFAISLESQRVTDPTQFGCYRMYATGTYEGSMNVTKSADAFNNAGESRTSTDLVGASGAGYGMDGVQLPDSADTANGCQTGGDPDCSTIASMASVPVTFTRSCNEIYTADAASTDPFGVPTAVTNVNADPDDIFP